MEIISRTYKKHPRDKDIAHIDLRPKSLVPEMSIALEAASFYYDYVLKELTQFADYSIWPNNLAQYHQRSLEQTKKIVELVYAATRQIKEDVF